MKSELEKKLPDLELQAEKEFQKESKLTIQLKEKDLIGESLINRCTDKNGNEGYYIVLTTVDVNGDTHQKIKNYKVASYLDRDWFKLLMYV